MNPYQKLLVGLLFISLCIVSCQKEDSDPPITDEEWEMIGLEGYRIKKLNLSENYVYAATSDGIYRNNLNDISANGWEILGLDDKDVLDFIIFNDQEILAAVELGADEEVSLYWTTDGGNNWVPYQQGFGGDEARTVRVLERAPDQPDLLFARGDYAVARSMDRGQSWELVFGEWDNVGYQAPLIKRDGNHPDYVWAGGENAIFQPYLMISNDLGETWVPADPPYEGDDAIYTLVAHPENPERILIGMEGQILTSTDGGQNWNTSISFEDGTYIIDMEHHPNDNEIIYATGSQGGTSGGNIFYYRSDDFGENWQLKENNEVSGTYFISDLEIQITGQEEILYFATDKGVYQYSER